MLRTFFLLCSAIVLVACEPELDCADGLSADGVTPGFTGIAVCEQETGSCQTFDKSCTKDDECFEILGQDAQTIPTWTRPQGGLGTRINVRLDGIPASNSQEAYGSLRSLFIREFEDDGAGGNISCTVEQCACNRSPAQGPCTADDLPECGCDVDAEFECARDVPGEGNVCAVVIGDQVNRQFPLVCSTDGTVHIEEMPVQFRSRWRDLNELDGVSLTLFSIIELADDSIIFGKADVSLDSGEFVPPSWFELGAPQPR